jgi:hypothetical protein
MRRDIGSQGRIFRLKINFESLQLIVIQVDCKVGVNKSNHPIQNLLLLVFIYEKDS